MVDFNCLSDVLSLKCRDIQPQYMGAMQCLKCKISSDKRELRKQLSLNFFSIEELVDRFLLLFVLDGISKSGIFKTNSNIEEQPLCDVLTSEAKALIFEALSCLQKSLMQDRIFRQRGPKIACDGIRRYLYFMDNIKITSSNSDVKWYQALLDYKRSGIMTSRESTENTQELSFEAMDKICDGIGYQLESQSIFYYGLDPEGRYNFQRDLQLTPLKFFLATYLAKNERPHPPAPHSSTPHPPIPHTPKFDAIMEYICGDCPDDIYDVDNKWIEFFLNELSQKYHYKILSKRDPGCTAYANNLLKTEFKKIQFINENAEKLGKYSQVGLSWDSSLEESLHGVEQISDKNWEEFFETYRIKCLDAFDQITRECLICVTHNDKSPTSKIVPNYSLNLIAFDQVTHFVWLTDLWIAKHTYLSSAFENMPTSNIKAALRDYSIHGHFDFDADGIALLSMCINLPIDLPKSPVVDCEPYCNYVKKQQNLISDFSEGKVEKASIPHPQLSPDDEKRFIWI